MVLESKPVPIYSNVYHIEFSVFLAVFTALGLLFLFQNRNRWGEWMFILLIIAVVLNIANLHILTARTGILTFWAALTGFVVAFGFNPFKRPLFWITAIAGVILILAIPSSRNRMWNSWEDFNAIRKGQDLNNKSFGQRWIAWQVAGNIIQSHWVKGVGMQNVAEAMHVEYAKNGNNLKEYNRIMPHNQYLENSLQSGVLAGLVFFTGLLGGIRDGWRKRNAGILGFCLAFAVACMFESLLERQTGVMLFAFLLPVLSCWTSPTNSE